MSGRAVVSIHGGEFGWVVRNVHDLDRACLLLADWFRREEGESRMDLPPVHEAGWMRWDPCNPRSCFDGGGHIGHLHTGLDGPGRGRWWGVWFDWGYA